MGKRRAKFPGLGSTIAVKFVERAPERAEGESDAAFARRQAFFDALQDAEIDVVLGDRDTVLELENEYALAWAKEVARHKASGEERLSLEFAKDVQSLNAKVVRTLVRRVRGIDVGDVSLDDVNDAGLIVELLTASGLLGDAAKLARAAQSPTPTQLEH